ncbi:TOX high mobility group box family member 4 [Neopsephotus bourkii]|uniref:TOX high mobility group box family member 4 n=1 Tax=Neopsephotus bourkii TaxID=309878 RepID=UPI002AA583D3|nr:TOX high mobility group box family member 4 [Neopsephotus bourkii]
MGHYPSAALLSPQFPGGSDNYLAITGTGHPFLTGAETFHTPSLGDEEFELPPISLEPDPSLPVSVGHFEDLGEPGGANSGSTGPYGGVQALDMAMGHGLMEQGAGLLAGGLAMELEHTMSPQYSTAPPVTIDVPMAALSPGGLLAPGQLTTIDQSELSSQLGLSLGANGTPGSSGGTPPPSQSAPAAPEERISPPPSPAGSGHEEEAEEFRRNYPPRRGKPPKKAKKKKDPNEPQKPVSAYALFFRDTQAAIKGQNPNATFGEVSKIVASMWDSLGEEQKQVYKRKTEAAKKEYLKALAAYRAVLAMQHPVPVATASAVATATAPPPRLRLTLPVATPAPGTPPLHIKILPPLRVLAAPVVTSSSASAPEEEEEEEEEVVEMVGGEFGGEAESPPGLAVELVPEDPPPARCIRAGCGNAPVASGDWDEEYCSSECVVRHCRDVFLAWLAARNAGPNSVVFVK